MLRCIAIVKNDIVYLLSSMSDTSVVVNIAYKSITIAVRLFLNFIDNYYLYRFDSIHGWYGTQ